MDDKRDLKQTSFCAGDIVVRVMDFRGTSDPQAFNNHLVQVDIFDAPQDNLDTQHICLQGRDEAMELVLRLQTIILGWEKEAEHEIQRQKEKSDGDNYQRVEG